MFRKPVVTAILLSMVLILVAGVILTTDQAVAMPALSPDGKTCVLPGCHATPPPGAPGAPTPTPQPQAPAAGQQLQPGPPPSSEAVAGLTWVELWERMAASLKAAAAAPPGSQTWQVMWGTAR